jgi:hypothetical protein
VANKDSEQVVTPEGARIGWTPVPDPTKLTTDAVNLATTQMRRELETQREIIEARILAGENESHLQLEGLRNVRPEIERQISQLKALHDEKFSGIEQRFQDRDARARDVAVAGEKALLAAFESAKELSALVAEQFKSEIASLKQAADERAKAQDIQFQTLKERIDRGEGQGQGASYAQVEQREGARTQIAANGVSIAAAAALISIAAIIVVVILAFRK